MEICQGQNSTTDTLFDKDGKVIRGKDDVLFVGVGTWDAGAQATIYVNLFGRQDNRWNVEVYDADAGGPIDSWVSELYTEEAEARAAFQGRLDEVKANVPNYVRNVWSG